MALQTYDVGVTIRAFDNDGRWVKREDAEREIARLTAELRTARDEMERQACLYAEASRHRQEIKAKSSADWDRIRGIRGALRAAGCGDLMRHDVLEQQRKPYAEIEAIVRLSDLLTAERTMGRKLALRRGIKLGLEAADEHYQGLIPGVVRSAEEALDPARIAEEADHDRT